MGTVESVVFWVAGISAVLSGIGVIAARSAIYSALSLIVTLGQFAILYLLLNAQFIAAAQILIYAGAVMVLFLFVITLLGVRDYEFMGEHTPFQAPLSIILAALLLFGIIFFVAEGPAAVTGTHADFNAALTQNNTGAFGTQLFTTFVFPFEVTTLILIVAMVGAVALGRRRGPSTNYEPRRAPAIAEAPSAPLQQPEPAVTGTQTTQVTGGEAE